MSNFVPLEEAAKKLGVSADELVEMLSRGEIFGYRDGASWKFKPTEIERVASELMGDALDEDPAGSSILLSESELGTSSSHGSTIGSAVGSADGSSEKESDVELVADPGSGSDVRLVANKPADRAQVSSSDDDELRLAVSDDDDDELSLAADEGDDLLAGQVGSDVELAGSDLSLAGSSAIGSDIPLSDSDRLDLSGTEASDVLGGDSDLSLAGSGELIKGDSDPSIDSELGLSLGSDLELSDDGDLVLGGSDLALGSDSGINLMSPADSGISLEDEPLDLAASGISGMDLASEGSAVDFQQDEEFQLSPSGALETDDDSGSQVIELEDSSEFGDAEVAIPSADGFDAFADVDSGGLDGGFGETVPTRGAVIMGAPEVPYSLPQVLSLLGILLLMCLSGILVSDVVRNMWAWTEQESSLTSGFTEMILGAFGMK
jgi:excisionase family DNA binding protein